MRCKSPFSTCLAVSAFLAWGATLPGQSVPPGDLLNRPLLGEHKILFIQVQYPGDTGGIVSDAAMQNIAHVVKESLEANSYGTLTVSIDVTPVLKMPQPDAYYQFDAVRGVGPTLTRIRADAVALAEQAGYAVADYDREVIYTKKQWESRAAGFGTFNFRTAFVSCNCDYLTVHELGHSFDWKHANFWRVESGSPISADGREINYGDAFDIMGDQIQGRGRAFHHFNPWYKMRVGWLPEANIATVTESDTFTVQALEHPPDTLNPVQKYSALRIKKDAATDYWVFYRAREEFANAGALITLGFHTNRRATLLLDMTPGAGSEEWKDAALTPGHLFFDPDAGVELKVLEKTNDALRVQVFVAPNPAGSVPVIDVLQPVAGQTVSGTVRYEVTAFDPDAGAANGSGMARVRLELENTLAEEFAQIWADTVLHAPPYALEVDTRALNDDGYFLLVTAFSADGDSNQVRFPHIIDNTGPSFPTSVADNPPSLPDRFRLFQNYPNPFNPETTIRYRLATPGPVELAIFDIRGRRVRTLVRAKQRTGAHTVNWDGRDAKGRAVASGVYVYRLVAGGRVQVRRMVVVR